jgi:hypothetical protein
MTALTHKLAKVNGVALHYVVTGAGPVVLCMHGWPQQLQPLPQLEAEHVPPKGDRLIQVTNGYAGVGRRFQHSHGSTVVGQARVGVHEPTAMFTT